MASLMSSTVWVTGAYGFIGRHLSKQLHKNRPGMTISGIGHGAWHVGEKKKWGMSNWLESDINQEGLDSLYAITGTPEEIYHIAGGSSVGRAMQNPIKDFAKTVQSTANLLEWVRVNAPTAKVIYASSAAVYGAGHQHPISESAPMFPFSPYGFHKRMGELLLKSYSENFRLKTATIRLFSVYGAELRKQILWDVSNRLAGRPTQLEMFGTGQEKRDFIHVVDAVELLILAGTAASEQAPIINGGTGIPFSISDLTELICHIWGCDIPVFFNGIQRSGDPEYLVANIDLASQIGFTPRIKISEGLQEYVTWFQHSKEFEKR